jgi:hypothetical protein
VTNVSMLVEDMSRNKCFSFQVPISHVLYQFVTYLLTLPCSIVSVYIHSITNCILTNHADDGQSGSKQDLNNKNISLCDGDAFIYV